MSETDCDTTNPSPLCVPPSPILDYAPPPPVTRSSLAVPALIVVAFADAILWRAEVEWHGWGGLFWISYFHWAIPIGAVLFLLWLFFFCELVPRPNRPVFFAVLAAFCILSYKPILWSLQWHYEEGPLAYYRLMFLRPIHLFLQRSAVFIIYPAIPCSVWLVARFSRIRISTGRFIVSLLIWLASVPLACLALAIIDHVGGSDSIHAIKSGFVIPPLVFALGLLFCPLGRRQLPGGEITAG